MKGKIAIAAVVICTIPYGNGTIFLRDDGLVVISDGISQDAIPLEMTNIDLVQRFVECLEKKEKEKVTDEKTEP